MLRRPQRLEAARLECLAEFARLHRVIGKEHRRAKIHLSLHRFDERQLNLERSTFARIAPPEVAVDPDTTTFIQPRDPPAS